MKWRGIGRRNGLWHEGRRYHGRKHFFGLDVYDVLEADVDPAALELQAVLVTQELITGHVEALAAPENKVFSTGEGGGEKRK